MKEQVQGAGADIVPPYVVSCTNLTRSFSKMWGFFLAMSFAGGIKKKENLCR